MAEYVKRGTDAVIENVEVVEPVEVVTEVQRLVPVTTGVPADRVTAADYNPGEWEKLDREEAMDGEGHHRHHHREVEREVLHHYHVLDD